MKNAAKELIARLDGKRAERLLTMLRHIALSQVWEDQGGCPSLSDDGRWLFAASCVDLAPDAVDLAFELTGIAKQAITPRGDCRTCVFAENGRERGYRVPCVSCKRPVMSNYEPRPQRTLGRRRLIASEQETKL